MWRNMMNYSRHVMPHPAPSQVFVDKDFGVASIYAVIGYEKASRYIRILVPQLLIKPCVSTSYARLFLCPVGRDSRWGYSGAMMARESRGPAGKGCERAETGQTWPFGQAEREKEGGQEDAGAA
jgi:hypothetical protein